MNRDYYEKPLKRGEYICYEDLYEFYINQNYSREELCEIFNTTKDKIDHSLRRANIKKPSNLKQQVLERNMINKYGVKNIFEKTDYIKQKTFEKLGVTNAQYLESTKQKYKETCLEKYGATHAMKAEEIKEKVKNTNQQKYGGNAPICNKSILNKVQKTNNERYGGNAPHCSPEIKQKIKNTILQKYGTDSIFKADDFKRKSKETCLEKYGTEYANQSDIVKGHIKESNLQKYGKQFYTQTSEFQKRFKETSLQNFGTEHPNQNPHQLNKILDSIKKNNSFKKSKPEDYCYQRLCEKFKIVNRQVPYLNHSKYRADFYLPELDLFIEYQGYQGHGFHPYNRDCLEDQELLKYWNEKAKQKQDEGKLKNQYYEYIRRWTIVDPDKRKIAKQQNMKLLEFFNKQEFDSWIDNF